MDLYSLSQTFLKLASKLDPEISEFDQAVNDIYKTLADLEEKFLDAREKTDSPVKKVFLTGIHSEIATFKAEKLRDYFRMLQNME